MSSTSGPSDTVWPIGIDFGGTGIKAAPVDLVTGEFARDRKRIDTPKPATPEAVAEVMRQLVDAFPESTGPVGVCAPAVVRRGVLESAANIDKSWIGVDADALLTERLGRPVHVLNDADAAGYAELQYGAAKGRTGLVILTTLGTGIGSAFLYEGRLIPNSELGHLEIDGHDAESRAATSARERDDLSWKEWGKRLTTYYKTLEKLFSPDLFVVGGGVSKNSEKFFDYIDISTEIIPAQLRNSAGIVGAAAQSHLD
ncbi:polyphosphate glucokinase [Marmoricola endophyticus]|uniref:Polyphosphate glucokinase n=1 Tax=Marmoricola endophyticus TaxID=2040280 RepID=A0A917F663_9ACTN|nr:ROK family protein [Marmoricola endophyticus]GGF47607.1 polyphosphate glucokinase [Marmoricola endophyticus]